jgi:uncharacterized protein RhaS with RHS repeats
MDAITGRFLSADPYISEPGNTQNFNRYGYVYNNPLSYVDPSGFEEEIIVTANNDPLRDFLSRENTKMILDELNRVFSGPERAKPDGSRGDGGESGGPSGEQRDPPPESTKTDETRPPSTTDNNPDVCVNCTAQEGMDIAEKNRRLYEAQRDAARAAGNDMAVADLNIKIDVEIENWTTANVDFVISSNKARNKPPDNTEP